ncbi:alpha/beta fold hydrolase [Chelativorans sp. AA-79]|uniref:alpha/beta fold hydrolase n=1 Tax=Chelativorans sp. AA-79 TaxID=3028735 RepID=UPI0023F65F07|nr:alpha/beta fold hydrolase [Chelativorans sp. AA-79]WEX07935.1 alpha/beta fold hydrolase [Chelativorans sp. AA-79]
MSATGEGGPALVLLHGFGGTHRVWNGVRAGLGGNIRVLAYDLPGHGGSLPVPEAGGAGTVAKAVLADLTARGVERFHVGGHSFGGAVAALAALAEPGRVLSISLFAPGGIGPEIDAPLLRDYAEAATREALVRCLSAMTGRGPLPEGLLADAQAMRAVRGQMEALARLYPLITRDGRQGVIARERLASLPMPVRVAWGGQDRVLPVRQVENLPPHFLPHIFPELGHMLPVEDPGAMAQILLAAVEQ